MIRRSIGILLVFAAALAAPGSGRAQAPYVLYNAAHGDWTVTCARSMTNGTVSCRLSAPPPKMGRADPGVQIDIDDDGTNAKLSFRVLAIAEPSRPVLLTIDADAPIVTEANVYGEGGWRGAKARALIDAMGRGRRLGIAWTDKDRGSMRSAAVDLSGFAAALDDYRKRRAGFGAGR